MRLLFLVIATTSLACPAAGCSPRGVAHYHKTLSLSRESPRAGGVELVRVEADGSAVIRARSTGEVLAAEPGGFFLGQRRPPDNVRVFGEHGLQLIRSDPHAQSAVLRRRGARPVYLP